MTGRPRAVGVWGTVVRAVLGVLLVGSVVYGHVTRGWHPVAWVLGLLVFPAVVVAGLWWRSSRHPEPLRAVGPLGHAINVTVLLALYFTWWYAPPVAVISDATLIFYGGSMLLAAWRGYGGCEVFAVSNWLLRRDDQVGCAPFWPIDTWEKRHAARHAAATKVGGPARR
jgi:hypothetical protein